MSGLKRVYVVELDPEVKKHKKFCSANPEMDYRLTCYYVGQTAHDPKHRFWQHQIGGKLSNSYVYKYGKRLCPEIYERFNPVRSREDAEILEQNVAALLRSKGHGVWSN